MKISKKTREQAALICAIAASSGSGGRLPYYNMIADDLGIPLDPPFCLAVSAWQASVNPKGREWTREADAEAEAKLRTGWRPK